MRYLNLAFVLWSDINYRELMDFFDVADGFDWFEVPRSQSRRGTRPVDSSPGLTGNSGYFIWYDPYTSTLVDSPTAHYRSRTSNPYEDDLPTNYVFVSDENGARRCFTHPAQIMVAPVVPDVPMVSASVLFVVPDSARVIAAVRTLLEQSGIPVEGVLKMADSESVLASLSNSSSAERTVLAEEPAAFSVCVDTMQPASDFTPSE